ncbi:MAG: hypothetical protein WCI71_00965 [Bacteroidota bacterium]
MTQKLIRLELSEAEAALIYYSLIGLRQTRENEYEKERNQLVLRDIEEVKVLISRVFQEINRKNDPL